MKPFPSLKALGIAFLFASMALAAQAGPGHDHGDGHGHGAPAAPGQALPRFAATSDLFELVGVLDGKRLTLYLDRADDNSPVPDAKLEIELAGSMVQVEPLGEGEFQVLLAEAPKEGVLAVTATVLAGSDSDLLAGELELHLDAAASTAEETGFHWKTDGGWALAALLALVATGLALTRQRGDRRSAQSRQGGAA